MDPKYINLVVAGTNLLGLVPFAKAYKKRNPTWKNNIRWVEAPLIGGTIIASTLMHLSETKHGLPGICLQSYSNHLLWLDRLFALTTCSYVVYRLYKGWNKNKFKHSEVIAKIIGSLLCNFFSEKVVKKTIYFAILHSCWHGLAYSVLLDVI